MVYYLNHIVKVLFSRLSSCSPRYLIKKVALGDIIFFFVQRFHLGTEGQTIKTGREDEYGIEILE